jgi:hypothetical protein
MVYASFAISVLTLAVLIWYAWLKRGIEKAANEQSEGLAKPVIVVESSPDIPDSNVDEAILGGGLFSEIVNGVRLLNIGTGPALWVEWSAKGQHNTGEGPESGSAGLVPYLRPNETVDTECSRAYVSGLNYLTVECRYQSLSRTRYTSRTTIGIGILRIMLTASRLRALRLGEGNPTACGTRIAPVAMPANPRRGFIK